MLGNQTMMRNIEKKNKKKKFLLEETTNKNTQYIFYTKVTFNFMASVIILLKVCQSWIELGC